MDLSDADAQFREWMREDLERAAVHFGLGLAREPGLGWMDRSIGALAGRGEEQFWLRVVSENKQWIHGAFWTGNLDANVFTGLAKPRVLDVYEWEEHRQQRAEVLTLLPGSPCSRTDALREQIDLPDAWWAELRRTVDVVASTPADRVNADQELVTSRIRQRSERHRGVVIISDRELAGQTALRRAYRKALLGSLDDGLLRPDPVTGERAGGNVVTMTQGWSRIWSFLADGGLIGAKRAAELSTPDALEEHTLR